MNLSTYRDPDPWLPTLPIRQAGPDELQPDYLRLRDPTLNHLGQHQHTPAVQDICWRCLGRPGRRRR